MRTAFKAAARATTVPVPKRVRKKTTRRGGDGRPYSTEWIVDDYLCLCRDPLSDLQRWIKEDKKKPSFSRLARQTRHGRHDTAAAQQFLRDTLRELSGRVCSKDNQGHNGPDVPRRSRAGAAEHRELQQVQAERNLTRAPPPPDDTAAQLALIHDYYAWRIAAIRGAMPASQAEVLIGNIRIEKIVAIRNAKDQRRAEQAARKQPGEPVRPAFKAVQLYKRCG
jgi:hypothetical protein